MQGTEKARPHFDSVDMPLREDLTAAVEWCKEHGLEFDYINENARECVEKVGAMTAEKIFAHEYIDDKATNPVKERAWIRRLRKAKAEKADPGCDCGCINIRCIRSDCSIKSFILRKETRNMAKKRKQDGKLPLLWSEFDHRRWRRHDSAAAGRSGNNAMHMRKGYGIPRNGEQKNRGQNREQKNCSEKDAGEYAQPDDTLAYILAGIDQVCDKKAKADHYYYQNEPARKNHADGKG